MRSRLVYISLIIALCVNLIPFASLAPPVMAQANWTKGTNPLVLPGNLVGDPSVVYDGDARQYKMWFTQGPSNFAQLDSLLGSILNQVTGNLTADMKVLNFNNIATADAADVKAILTYLAGLSTSQLDTVITSLNPTIGYAASSDNGSTWAYQPVTFSSNATWEQHGITSPTVIRNSATSYEMWYVGRTIDTAAIKNVLTDLSLLSTENITALLTDILVNQNIGSFFSHLRAARGDQYVLDFLTHIAAIMNGTGGAIGHATSSDGIAWNKDALNPVVVKGPGEVWDKYSVDTPTVIKNSPTSYEMWYTGFTMNYSAFIGLLGASTMADVGNVLAQSVNYAIGHATYDGVRWNKDTANNPVVTKGTGSAWDKFGVGFPTVVRSGSSYQMWYTGFTSNLDTLMNVLRRTMTIENALISGAGAEIGHAAYDGVRWNKDGANPVLPKGTGNVWDKLGASAPGVLPVGNDYWMWYTGTKSTPATLLPNILDRVPVATALTNSNTAVAIGFASSPARVCQSITVSPASASIAAGRTQAFTAMGAFSDGTNENLTSAPGILWSSSNTARASISSTGVASALTPGSAIITANFGGAVSNQVVLSVTAPVLTSITVTPAGQTVALGLTKQFTAMGRYTDNSTSPVTNVATWQSNNTGIATVATNGLATSIATGTANITASVVTTEGTVSGFTSLTVTPPEVTDLEVTPANPSVPAGGTMRFYATEQYTNNTNIDRTNSANWTSATPGVASISPTTGAANALAVGTTNISATYGGRTGWTILTVTAATLQSLAISGVTDVPAGTDLQLTLTGTFSDNSPRNLTTDNATVWASLSPAIATVSRGLVHGVARGSANITATNSGVKGWTMVNVVAPTLQTITVIPANPKVTVSGSLRFTATGTYTDNSTSDISSSVVWSTDNATVASVDNVTGLATAGTTPGTATITATLTPRTGSTTLTVTAATLDSITVTSDNLTVAKGSTRQMVATGFFNDSTNSTMTRQVTWTSGAPTIATVGATTGVVTGVATGQALITATHLSGKTGSANVTVGSAELVSIAVTPTGASVAAGRTQQYAATGRYTDSTTLDITSQVAWGSSIPGIAGISTLGVATGVAPGTTNITASKGTIASPPVALVVTPKVLVTITVSPLNQTIIAGRTLLFTAAGSYSDGSVVNPLTGVAWSSNNLAAASIDATGLARGAAAGTTSIAATKDGITGTAQLTVNAAVLDSISLTPLNPVIERGGSQTFRATGVYSDGSRTDVTATSSWVSDNLSVATITSPGVATSSATGAIGTTTIRVTKDTKTASTILTVTAASLTSITVTATSLTVPAGRSRLFTATGTYSDNTTSDLTSVATWASNNLAVARIVSAGQATSFIPGTTQITASKGTVPSLPVTLTVSAPELDSISVTPPSPTLTLVAGNPPTLQFTATGVYSDGSTTPLTTSSAWLSGTPGTAAIGPATGLATAGAAGTTNISAGNSGKTGWTILTVLPDTRAPVITLSSPTEGLTVTEKSLTVTGRVDDLNATAAVILNGVATPLPLDPAGNFSLGVILNTGKNAIMVRASDTATPPNTGTSGTRNVTVDPKKPVITLTSPIDGVVTNNRSVRVAGTVSGSTQVAVRVNGAMYSVDASTGSFSNTYDVPDGDNVFAASAYATGHSGDSDYMGTSGTRRVTVDSTPPVVNITSPLSGSIVSTGGVMVVGTVNDPTVSTALLVLNGGTPQTMTVTGGSFRQNITLAPGINRIVVVATDQVGNTSPSGTPITVTLDTSKPSVTVTAPANQLLTNMASQTVTGSVNDPNISSVNLYVNGMPQPVSVAPDGTFSASRTLGAGSTTLEVSAQDNAVPPNLGTSGVITVTVDTTAPELSIGLGDPTDSITITVTSTEALRAAPTVTVNPGATAVTMAQVEATKWVGTYGPIPAGTYTVTVAGADTAGNNATETATFTKTQITVDGVNPTRVESQATTLDVQTNGAVSNASITVTQQLQSPSGNAGAPSGAGVSGGAYVEITAAPELLNNLKQIYIRVDYNPADLPQGTDQASLRLYLWDATLGTWAVVPGSGVDTVQHFIYGTVDHLSQYGVFGGRAAGAVGPGGGGTSVVITNVSLTGLSAAIPLRVDDNGIVQVASTLLTPDGNVSLFVPQNTMMKDVTARALTTLSASRITAPATAPPQKVIILAYEFGPNGATFAPYLGVTMKYDPVQLPPGVSEAQLYMAFWDGTQWVALDSQVDTAAKTVTAKAGHFTQFGIVATLPAVPPAPTPTVPTVTPPKPTVPTVTPPKPTVPTVTPPKPTVPTVTPTIVPSPKPTATAPVPPVPPAPPAANWWLIIGIVVAVVVVAIIVWRVVAGRGKV